MRHLTNRQLSPRINISLHINYFSHILVSADYSQIEMRVLAHLCKDPVLLSLFGATQGYDIYRHLAARILNRPVADVPEEDRTKAKVICLGTVKLPVPLRTCVLLYFCS